MLRIEVKSNKDNSFIKSKVAAKETHTLEAIYLMATAYNLIKKNDETGLTDKELMKEIKDLNEEFNRKKEK